MGGSSNVCTEGGEQSSKIDGFTVAETSLDSEEMLGVDSKDEEVRNIKPWYKSYKDNKRRNVLGEKENDEVSMNPVGKQILLIHHI